mmetsp:Transcript_20192/g.69315  ORF Transcript_20192/g.69315 Transcript_20192/m.69315 type:complete len:412 (-) Transcript_20192:15-1250(-)
MLAAVKVDLARPRQRRRNQSRTGVRSADEEKRRAVSRRLLAEGVERRERSQHGAQERRRRGGRKGVALVRRAGAGVGVNERDPGLVVQTEGVRHLELRKAELRVRLAGGLHLREFSMHVRKRRGVPLRRRGRDVDDDVMRGRDVARRQFDGAQRHVQRLVEEADRDEAVCEVRERGRGPFRLDCLPERVERGEFVARRRLDEAAGAAPHAERHTVIHVRRRELRGLARGGADAAPRRVQSLVEGAARRQHVREVRVRRREARRDGNGRSIRGLGGRQVAALRRRVRLSHVHGPRRRVRLGLLRLARLGGPARLLRAVRRRAVRRRAEAAQGAQARTAAELDSAEETGYRRDVQHLLQPAALDLLRRLRRHRPELGHQATARRGVTELGYRKKNTPRASRPSSSDRTLRPAA